MFLAPPAQCGLAAPTPRPFSSSHAHIRVDAALFALGPSPSPFLSNRGDCGALRTAPPPPPPQFLLPSISVLVAGAYVGRTSAQEYWNYTNQGVRELPNKLLFLLLLLLLFDVLCYPVMMLRKVRLT